MFKVITAAATVDSRGVGPGWSYYDNGALEYGGVVIRNSDREAHGTGPPGLLSSSLNVGAATLSTQIMGADVFYRYVRAFGFGPMTGIELVVAEVPGFVHLPTDWDGPIAR